MVNRTFWRGVWRLVDPKITLASAASLLLGFVYAGVGGPLHWGWLALTVLGVFFLEAAKNASGEVFDLDSDLAVAPEHRSPFSGGKRVIVDGLMNARATMVTALVFYAFGAAAGLAVVVLREPWVLALGAVGVALAYFYNAPPVRLAYRGLGEVAVALAYGPLISAGAYLVQRGTISPELLQASVPLAGLVAAFLWINEFPDYEADRATGKRNLVVRLGPQRAARAFGWLIGASFATAVIFALLWQHFAMLGGLLGLPFAMSAARRVLRAPRDIPTLIPAQGHTLLSFLLYAGGASLGRVLIELLTAGG